MAYREIYNCKNPAVKRLMREAAEMNELTEDCSARPINDNLFEWHFTIRGSPDSDFKNGIYHGRITFPNEYPMKPPNIMLLTPNGRFVTNKKICLSISGHHPETWQPSWSVRTALLALIAFMPTPNVGTIGSLDYSSDEKQILARKSQTWECPECGKIKNLLILNGNLNISRENSNTDVTTKKDILRTCNEAGDGSVGTLDMDDATNNNDNNKVNWQQLDPSNGKFEQNITANCSDVTSNITISSLSTQSQSSSCQIAILTFPRNTLFMISIIVLIIAFLIYRRLYLL